MTEYEKKLSICKACPNYWRFFGTCGTPIFGKLSQHNGNPVYLCGCVMKVKLKLLNPKCPIQKF